MTEQEKFEAWWKSEGITGSPAFKDFMEQSWQAAQAAKDAETAELRENLAKCRELFEYQKAWMLSRPGFVKCFIKLGELCKQAEEACGL